MEPIAKMGLEMCTLSKAKGVKNLERVWLGDEVRYAGGACLGLLSSTILVSNGSYVEEEVWWC